MLDVERWTFAVGMKIFWPVFAAILAAAVLIALVTTDKIPRRIVWRIIDLIVAGVFIYAGVIKISDPVQFANDIDNYKILPWMIGVGLAFYLPWLEVFCGLALLFRFLYRGALSILAALIAIFIVAAVAAKARGLDITCGCFGHASQHWNFPAHMTVDLALLASVLLLVWAGSAKSSELLRS
jgi:putative oxidoreductase